MRRRYAPLAFVLVASACAAPNASTNLPPCGPAGAAEKPAADPNKSAAQTSATQGPPAVEIRIAPTLGKVSVDVTMVLDARAGQLGRVFVIHAPDAEAFRLNEARDSRSTIDVRRQDKPGQISVELGRLPEGELRLSYTVSSRAIPGRMPFLLSDPDRLQMKGDALLLPELDGNPAIQTSLKVDISTYGTLESGASISGVATSYGIGGATKTTTTFRELRNAVFVAGRMDTAVFDTHEGHDEAAWFGYTAFDARPVSADNAAFRTAAGEFFGERSPEPFTLLIVPDSRPKGSFVAARYTHSVILHVSVSEPWSGPLRITTAVEILHAWMGERLWIGPEDPARAGEGAWFEAGVTRHLARDMLFRFGLVTPTEVADEVNGLEAVVATSPHAKKSNAELAAHLNEPGVVPLIVARGALYALSVDAALRAKKKDAHDLSAVLRSLYGQAKERRGPLPTSAWIEALEKELGKSAAETFVETIERGDKLVLTDNALGPCFRQETRKYVRYDLGFDEAASLQKEPRSIVGLSASGPAAKAGLKEGDVLVSLQTTPGRSDVPVFVVVDRAGSDFVASYLPAGAAAQGRGWTRRKDIPDESCTK